MSNTSKFTQDVMLFVPDAPEPVIEVAVKDSVRRMMRETTIARDTSTAKTQDCVLDYQLNLPECRTVVAVHAVRVAGRPAQYEMDGPNQAVLLHQQPRAGAALDVDYSWTIKPGACDAPDYIYDDFIDVVRFGALRYMHAMPGQEWSSMPQSAFYAAQFDEQVSYIRAKVLNKFYGTNRRIVSPRFVGSSATTSMWNRNQSFGRF